MKRMKFDCGCCFDVDDRGSIDFDLSLDSINLDCERTWDLISDGNTKGCFQLESRLGQSIAKKAKPKNIEELAALISIMRPGCMEAMVEDKSLTNHYIDRKHNREEVDYFHPSLEPILKSTYGILVYQEQSMQIAQAIAGFNLQDADILRKAIGKKNPSEMAKVKKMFISGARTLDLVTKSQSEEIFGWIEKSQRYSFNKSHAVSYAINGYLSAYCKSHFKKEFFTSYLYYSKEKQKPHEEINELINNAKTMDVDIWPPNIVKQNKHFKLEGEKIYFGLSDIKGVGESVIKKIKDLELRVKEETGSSLEDLTSLEFLVFFAKNINITAAKALISCGATSHFDSNRTKNIHYLDILSALSKKEFDWLKEYVKDNRKACLNKAIKAMLSASVPTKLRMPKVQGLLTSIEIPPFPLEDGAEWVSGVEESLLGIALTCSKVDGRPNGIGNCTCKGFIKGECKSPHILIPVQIDAVREITIKNGQNKGAKMAFVTISDSTCAVDAVAFSDVWGENKSLLTEGNTVLINGDKDRERKSIIIQNVTQI